MNYVLRVLSLVCFVLCGVVYTCRWSSWAMITVIGVYGLANFFDGHLTAEKMMRRVWKLPGKK